MLFDLTIFHGGNRRHRTLKGTLVCLKKQAVYCILISHQDAIGMFVSVFGPGHATVLLAGLRNRNAVLADAIDGRRSQNAI